MQGLNKTINVAKNKLRQILLMATKALKIDELSVNHQRINENLADLLQDLNLNGSTAILSYQAHFPAEVPVKIRFKADVFFPVVADDRSISFYEARPSELKPGKYKIPEPPTDIPFKAENYDNIIVLVPGLAFSSTGKRMGRGLGCYDNFIANSKLNLIKIGISLEQFVLEDIPVEDHDQNVDYLITGLKIRKFV